MKKINQKATKVFNKLIELMDGKDYLKLDNSDGSFMPLSIERLSTGISFGPIQIDIFSLTHYFKQNGDLVPDPDMSFAVSQSNKNSIWALSYQDQFGYQEGVFQDSNSVWKINKHIQRDHTSFASMWLQNIKQQQNI